MILLTHTWEDKGIHTFPKRFCPNMNVIARQEYELAYNDSAVHRFNHYTLQKFILIILIENVHKNIIMKKIS